MARTGRFVDKPRNTSDLAICSTRQPIAWAASAALRVEAGSSTTWLATPSAFRASCTRCAVAGNASAIEYLLSISTPVAERTSQGGLRPCHRLLRKVGQGDVGVILPLGPADHKAQVVAFRAVDKN